MLETLKQLRKQILQRGLGITIHDIKKLCTDNHLGRALADVESVENDYNLLAQFFASGFEDAERMKVYHKLERRLYNIILGLIVENIADRNPTFKQCRTNALSQPFEYSSVESTLSQYDQELTLASLDADAQEKQRNIHQRLLQYRIFLFNSIYTSRPWTVYDSEAMTRVLLSPLVDVVDQQIILGAMFMAQRTVFDALKFKTLCEVAAQSGDDLVRQRALVAIALALPSQTDERINRDIIQKNFKTLLSVDGMMQTFCDLQIQVLLCMDTEANNAKIKDDIMPTLMKDTERMMDGSKDGHTNISDLLHPDAEEKEMDKVEECVNRMRKMQESGADIFFGGFSQAKRFSFFYTLMNWFCPFYLEHPQVVSANLRGLPMPFLSKIVDGQYFCNSDKYSFILSLAHVISQIPKEMLDLMQKGEVSPAFEDPSTDITAYVRRSYLNDLYRFYNLYSDKNHFHGPFESEMSACFFNNQLFMKYYRGTAYPLRICRQLLRRGYYKALDDMLIWYRDSSNVEYLKLIAVNYEKMGRYGLAQRKYNQALELQPDNTLILSHLAYCAFRDCDYVSAISYYQRLLSLLPEDADRDVELYRMALCHLQLNETDDGMKILFRLSYNDPENVLYRKALAWGYLLQLKYDDAQKTYEAIDSSQLDRLDAMRLTISRWMNGNIESAIVSLKQFIKLNVDNRDANVYDVMDEHLVSLGLFGDYQTEAMILIDLALKQ